MGTGLDFTPALEQAHISTELVVAPGSGLDLAAPLKFSHAANLPFADREQESASSRPRLSLIPATSPCSR